MPTLDELLVKIDASTELLRRELNKGDASVSRFERNIDRKLGKIDKRFSNLGAGVRKAMAAFGVALGGVAVSHFTRSVASAGLEMERYERALKVAAGSQEGATREMEFLRKTADQLGLDLRALVSEYTALSVASKGTALEGRATRDIFLAVAEASSVLGLSAEQTGGALTAIQQIISKGRVSAEELRGQLGERLPGAFQIAARAMGVTTAQLDDMLKKGELTAEQLLPRMAAELHKTFGPEVANAAQSAQAQINKFNTAIFEMKVAIAESGILGLLASLARGFAAVATEVKDFFTTSDMERLEQIEAQLRELRQGQVPGTRRGPSSGLMADVMVPVPQAQIDPRIELLEAEAAEIRQRINDALKFDLDELRENHERARQELQRFFAETREEASLIRLPGPAPDAAAAPATVRLGGGTAGQPPLDPEEVARVNEALRSLEEQALRSQGRMEEAIRLAADAQIAEWERVAEETPQLAEHAGRAIELINQRAEADIRALSDMTPIVEQFATTFAASFESRGIDALLNGDIGAAVRGLAKDIAELTIRLLILKPLTDSLVNFFSPGSVSSSVPIGPPRAGGGRVDPHHAFPVGEKGPELFVPDVPGRILNSAQLSRMGGGGIVVNQQNNVQAGLPPQWQVQTAMMARIAAAEAEKAIIQRLGNRR